MASRTLTNMLLMLVVLCLSLIVIKLYNSSYEWRYVKGEQYLFLADKEMPFAAENESQFAVEKESPFIADKEMP